MRFQKEASDDIRLSVRLFKRCINDQRKFCADVEPGHMRVQVRGRAGGQGGAGGWARGSVAVGRTAGPASAVGAERRGGTGNPVR